MNNLTAVCRLDELPTDDVVELAPGGEPLAVYRVGDEVFVTSAFCSHGNARLCDGFLEGHEIECPLHQGRFDVRSGQPLCSPVTEALRTYPVKIEEGEVWVQLN